MLRSFTRKLMCFGASNISHSAEGQDDIASPIFNSASSILKAIAIAGLLGSYAVPITAQAQSIGEELFDTQVNSEDQLLLESDELIYDDEAQSVSAVGNVQIAYGDYFLVAERVTYNQATGRVIAVGNVEIVEPNGNKLFAQEIDITDDFQDGFVQALQVETADNTRFAAEGAERRDGEIAEFVNGVYTACERCKEDPSKPPLWQIRADRVIINSRTKRVEYEGASFELFGKPIAYLSKFSHADPSIKRSTGFLFPEIGHDEFLGYSIKNSYFLALAPNYDLTLSGTYFNRQGFLGETEWRHRTELGEYNLRFAGIEQRKPELFDVDDVDSQETGRYAFMTIGKFTINPRWKFGWNALHQSDNNFARTYNLSDYDDARITNEVYLTGLNDKNYFDLRAQRFLIQNGQPDDIAQNKQAKVLPSFDYNIVSDSDAANGQVSFDLNVANLRRDLASVANGNGDGILDANERHYGIPGSSTRASAELEWKKSSIINGAMVTASLSGRADGYWLNTEDLDTKDNPLTSNDSILRTMPAAMLEIRYPMIANDGMVSQIFEPIAQVIVRPDEKYIGQLPNDDAQSFVFDTTNLFQRSKFSGFDRVEGGTRANIGFRYSASFNNNSTLDIVAGQSFHLGGKNSFAVRDVVNAGLESGLETDKSDYVASLNFDTGAGVSFNAAGRFDESNAKIRRGEIGATYIDSVFAAQASYIFIDEQPNYGFTEDRHEIKASASLKLNENWRVFGSGSYDLENSTLYSRRVGISYDDSCFSFSLAYKDTDDRYSSKTTSRSINFSLGLRTIGSFETERTRRYELDTE